MGQSIESFKPNKSDSFCQPGAFVLLSPCRTPTQTHNVVLLAGHVADDHPSCDSRLMRSRSGCLLSRQDSIRWTLRFPHAFHKLQGPAQRQGKELEEQGRNTRVIPHPMAGQGFDPSRLCPVAASSEAAARRTCTTSVRQGEYCGDPCSNVCSSSRTDC